MNVRIVIIFLKSPSLLVRWKRADLPAPNAAARKSKDCLMDLGFAAEEEVKRLHKNITAHLPEARTIFVLCKRIVKNYDDKGLVDSMNL